MPDGFFSSSTLISKEPDYLTPRCGACGLYLHCKSPKMAVSGEGRKGILVVGEAPGETEDDQNKQFVGKTGRRLEIALRKAGIDFLRDCWRTNALICRPEGNEIKDEKWIDYCRPNLTKTIKEKNPRIIILLGSHAVKSLIGGIWKSDVSGINRWAGYQIPCQKPNAWICPTYHPSYISRLEDAAADLIFDKHIAEAVGLKGRPEPLVIDPDKKVLRIFDPEKAARKIEWFTANAERVAFDYETTCLKPEGGDYAQIVSCSISDGEHTIAFPWMGQTRSAMFDLLISPVKKIAANAKFEERWTIKEFGRGVRGWLWDTMQTAHVLDNRKEVTGLKFQAFALLGVESYDDHIKEFLRSRDGKKINRIREIDLDQLLKYNGLDAKIEYEVAQIQMKKLGFEQ